MFLQSTERAKEDVKAALQVLNIHLLPRTYLVGERITLADIGVACTLLHLYQYVLDTSFRLVHLLSTGLGLHFQFHVQHTKDFDFIAGGLVHRFYV